MRSIILIIAASFLLCLEFSIEATEAQESAFCGQVVAVSDGDTISVMHNGSPEKIRLSGIDCPEKKQAFGMSAKTFTADLCFGNAVTVLPKTRDRYGRTVAEIILPDGRDLNQELVGSGYAWWYRKYSPQDGELQQLESSARLKKTGLWADSNAAAPWEFRKEARNHRHQLK